MSSGFRVQEDPERANAFELGYCAALRKDLPAAWREGVLTALASAQVASELADDPKALRKRRVPRVNAFRLILMRCETAATMLAWRKELTPYQRERMRVALDRLQASARQLGVE